jgi:hypothetical protein
LYGPVLDPALPESVDDAERELGALVLLEPKAKNFLGAIGANAERDVISLVAARGAGGRNRGPIIDIDTFGLPAPDDTLSAPAGGDGRAGLEGLQPGQRARSDRLSAQHGGPEFRQRGADPPEPDRRPGGSGACLCHQTHLSGDDARGWLEHVQRWVQDLSAVHDEGTGETLFEWLRKPTTGTSQTDIADATQRLDVLRALGADKLVLAALPIAGMRHYARCRAIQKVQSLALLREPRRTTEVGCWLRLQFLQLNDVVLERISRRIGEPRRGTKVIGTYSHILDQWPIIYDQAIVLNQRQAGAAIEGVLQQQIAALQRLAVDTHGFTHLAMGLAKVLGFDLCPRLAGFSGWRDPQDREHARRQHFGEILIQGLFKAASVLKASRHDLRHRAHTAKDQAVA